MRAYSPAGAASAGCGSQARAARAEAMNARDSMVQRCCQCLRCEGVDEVK